jgi:hypothetical protein
MFDPRNPNLYQPYAPPPPLPNQGTTATPPQVNTVVEEQYKQTQDTTAIINEINKDINEGATSNLVGAVQLYWGDVNRLPAGWYVCDGKATEADRQLRVRDGITKRPDFTGRYPKGNLSNISGDGHVPQATPTTYKLTRDMVPWKPLTINYGNQSFNSSQVGNTPLETQTGDNSVDHTHDLEHTHGMKHRHSHSHTHKLNDHTHKLNSHSHSLNSHTHNLASHTHTSSEHNHGLTLATGYGFSSGSDGADRFAVRRNYTGDDQWIVHVGSGMGAGSTAFSDVTSAPGTTRGSTGGPSSNTSGPNSGDTGTNNDDSGTNDDASRDASTTNTGGSIQTGSTTSKDNTDTNTTKTSLANSVNHTHSYNVSHDWTEIIQGNNDDLPYLDPFHQEINYVIYEGAIVA